MKYAHLRYEREEGHSLKRNDFWSCPIFVQENATSSLY